jgi:hypothetical protein
VAQETSVKAGGKQGSGLAYYSTLKMEAICSSETSVDSQWTIWRYIPEDGTIHKHRCENLKSYRVLASFKLIPWGHSLSCRANNSKKLRHSLSFVKPEVLPHKI